MYTLYLYAFAVSVQCMFILLACVKQYDTLDCILRVIFSFLFSSNLQSQVYIYLIVSTELCRMVVEQ